MYKVYTKTNCSWCTKAKELLKKHNIEFEEINIDEDPDNIYFPVQDGIGYITLIGELEDVPPDWRGNYNCRISWPIEIKKDFYSSPLQSSHKSLNIL